MPATGQTTRRSLLGRGAKLALAAPVVVAALDGGTALAKSHSPRRRAFFAELCRVGDVATTDFAGSGTDTLDDGSVRVDGDRIDVRLEGAEPNVTYGVSFVHQGVRDDLGSITTDQDGDFRGRAPQRLPGHDRVGFFVVTRGADQFVSCANATMKNNEENAQSPSPSNNGNGKNGKKHSGGRRR